MMDLFPFVVGMLGSFHCLGMCGALVFACSLPPGAGSVEPGCNAARHSFSSLLVLQVVFHLGRLTTYALAGALTAAFFNALPLVAIFSEWYTSVTIACGALLVIFALVMGRFLPVPGMADRMLSVPLSAMVSWAPSLIRSPMLSRRYVLGVLTGLLPCCLSWSMVVTVAPAGDVFQGVATMLWFGLGTVPALLAAALFGFAVSVKARQAIEKLAALAVGGMGIALVLRGFGLLG
jgi:hypothetical protein